MFAGLCPDMVRLRRFNTVRFIRRVLPIVTDDFRFCHRRSLALCRRRSLALRRRRSLALCRRRSLALRRHRSLALFLINLSSFFRLAVRAAF
ncbi:unnamed protein product [Arabidopsis lyrata]|nr:unnamed protein product [Arabidopsis lyrata]